MVCEPRSYGFRERLVMSNGVATSEDVTAVLKGQFPGAGSVHKAMEANDRSGVDYWVEMRGRHLAVDIKARDDDFLAKGWDDLALETYSVVEKGVVGWTRDENKRCDYILWYWRDTRRWALVPFHPLCSVFQARWEKWRRDYKTATQATDGRYHSECVFVPRKLVWQEIYRWANGRAG